MAYKMDNDIAVENINGTIKTPSKRIIALDILRGWFLVIILINHIELYPSGFDYFTGRGRLLVSAAEGFFFMSGLLVGMVYRRRLALGMKYVFKKMWRRAGELYLAHIFLTILFVWAALFFNHPSIKDGLFNVPDWDTRLKQTLLMHYSFGWADWLDRYALLMFMAPFSFYLLAKGRWKLMIGASIAAWAFRQNPVLGDNNFTISWQLLFNFAMLIGFYWEEFMARLSDVNHHTRRSIKRAIFGVTILSFILSYLSVYVLSELNAHWEQLSSGWQSLTFHWNSVNAWVWLYSEKWTMGPVRVILFLAWFSALFIIVRRYEEPINRYSRHYLELLGRNSLFVYIAHAFVVFIFKLFIPQQTNLWMNFGFTAGALAVLIYMTKLYSQYRIHHRLNVLRPHKTANQHSHLEPHLAKR
jgi:hypothetical protein